MEQGRAAADEDFREQTFRITCRMSMSKLQIEVTDTPNVGDQDTENESSNGEPELDSQHIY